MTCDEIFDLLTLEPSRHDDGCREALLTHLAGCRSCRRLADALEPAVELLRECAGGDEFASSYMAIGPWNEPPEIEQPRESAPPRWRRSLATAGQFQGNSWTSAPRTPWLMQLVGGDLMRLAAMLLLGLTLGAFAWGRGAAETPQEDAPPYTMAPGPVTLASLKVAPACLPSGRSSLGAPLPDQPTPRIAMAGELLAASELNSLNCCTLCHASYSVASHSRAATLEVIRSCQACHTF